ncbi:MAG: response regulator, partial [Spirochaeta sp.]|nr:response regulator [Spirochaeta sp.]
MKTGLVVDDASIMRMRLREILEPRYTVIGEAGDGDEAVRLYQELSPDFVTLDISMPGTNGMQALEQLRAYDSTAKIVI